MKHFISLDALASDAAKLYLTGYVKEHFQIQLGEIDEIIVSPQNIIINDSLDTVTNLYVESTGEVTRVTRNVNHCDLEPSDGMKLFPYVGPKFNLLYKPTLGVTLTSAAGFHKVGIRCVCPIDDDDVLRPGISGYIRLPEFDDAEQHRYAFIIVTKMPTYYAIAPSYVDTLNHKIHMWAIQRYEGTMIRRVPNDVEIFEPSVGNRFDVYNKDGRERPANWSNLKLTRNFTCLKTALDWETKNPGKGSVIKYINHLYELCQDQAEDDSYIAAIRNVNELLDIMKAVELIWTMSGADEKNEIIFSEFLKYIKAYCYQRIGHKTLAANILHSINKYYTTLCNKGELVDITDDLLTNLDVWEHNQSNTIQP